MIVSFPRLLCLLALSVNQTTRRADLSVAVLNRGSGPHGGPNIRVFGDESPHRDRIAEPWVRGSDDRAELVRDRHGLPGSQVPRNTRNTIASEVIDQYGGLFGRDIEDIAAVLKEER